MSFAGRSLLREPLVHFLAFGVAVVSLQVAFGPVSPSPQVSTPEPLVVAVSDDVLADLQWRLTRTLGRPPRPDELSAEVDAWIRTEVLVREARERGLDRGSDVVRAHLAQEMVYVLEGSQVPDDPTDEALQTLLDAHPEDYTLDGQLTLRQLFVAGQDRDRAQALLVRLQAGEDPVSLAEVSDPPPGGPVLRGRTPERLAEVYGASFVEAVQALPEGTWGLTTSPDGLHLVRVERRQERRALTLEEARDRLVLRWKAEHARAATDATFDALRGRYEVQGWPL